MTRILKFAGIALCLAAALACQKAKLAEYKKLESEATVPRITVADAKSDVDAGIAVIVDSRPEFAYKHERIAGSINIPIGGDTAAFSTLPTTKKIIVYCS